MKYYTDGNDVFAYEADGSQDAYIKPELRPITEAEADAIRAAKQQALIDAMSYAERRAAEYPTFADQLDTIFHSGLDAWKAQIQAVKDKYPK